MAGCLLPLWDLPENYADEIQMGWPETAMNSVTVGNCGSPGKQPLQCLRGDTHRLFGGFSWCNVLKGALTRRSFRPLVTMRLCQHGAARRAWYLPLCKLLHRIAAHQAGMDFPWRTDIGAGLALTHGWGLVVNEGAKIGRNVTLFHGVTIGRRDRISRDGERTTEFPVIEDEVWIGPHAILVGGIVIGRGSRVAGGAYVTDSVPPYSIVAGNPSAVIKSDCVPDVMNPVP